MTQQDSALLRLLEISAVASNEAPALETAARLCIEEICKLTGWPVGHLYVTRRDGSMLDPTSVWRLDDDVKYQPFRELTERLPLAAGVGLPGRVLASGQAHWIVDAPLDANFPRAAVAASVGLHAGLAFPILIGSAVVGVLEFFAAEAAEPDEALLKVLARVGQQLGRLFERERASEALYESVLRFRAVAQSAADAIIVADVNGQIVFWNDAAERMFGYGALEIIGEPLTRLMPARYHAAYAAGLARLRNGGASKILGRTIELAAMRRDGREFPVELAVSTWHTDDQRFFSGNVRDISEHQARLRREREQESRLQQADKMTALGRLASGIAHDFNNVLTAISGNAQLALIGMPASDSRGELLTAIQHATDSGARLTSQLLAFGRPAQPDTQLIDLNAVIRNAIGMLDRTFGHDVAVQLDLDPELPSIQAGSSQIEQIVMNLALNARDAMTDGGRLLIRTSRLPSATDESTAPARDRVRVTISDSGCGIPADVLPRIFEPFYTTKGASGTGLGLATVYAIVQQHGGSVLVESTPGEGATFHVDLPVERDGLERVIQN